MIINILFKYNISGCTEDATTSACAIDIVHNSLGSDQHYEGYEAWAFGDSKLDWYFIYCDLNQN